MTDKALTVTITLGKEELHCLVLPNGEYKIAASQIAEFFSVPQKNASRDFKALLPEDFQYLNVKTDINPREIPVIDLTSVGIIALGLAFKGNKYAQAFCVASNSESIEERIDRKLNVLRTIEEKNERFSVRQEGILSRNFWTNVIHRYCEDNDRSDSYRKFIYPNVSNCLNKAMFGLSAKQIRAYYDAHSSEPTRDFLPKSALRIIDHVECYAAQLVNVQGYEPLEAIKEAITFWKIQPMSLDD